MRARDPFGYTLNVIRPTLPTWLRLSWEEKQGVRQPFRNDMTMNGITLITCTGGRPESLARCASYVARFDNPDAVPVQWIVVDDGPKPTSIFDLGKLFHGDLRCVRPRHTWQPGISTLALNLLEAIPCVAYDAVMFIEDDDVYKPDYMRVQFERMKKYELVGEGESRYYYMPTSKWRILRNVAHASLCQTVMRSSLLSTLWLVCKHSVEFIDVNLWYAMSARPTTYIAYDAEPLVIGMKGMPGRPGIGIGHRPELSTGWADDPQHKKLYEWLGNDAEAYIGPKTTPETVQNRAETAQDASVR